MNQLQNLPVALPVSVAVDFGAAELAPILGLTIRAVQKRLKTFEGVAPVAVRGGMQLRAPLHSLPAAWQRKVQRAVPGAIDRSLASKIDQGRALIAGMPLWQRREVGAWLEILQVCAGLKGEALTRRFVELEKKHPGIEISYSTYRRKLTAFEKDGFEGLAPGWGKSRGRTKVTEQNFRVFAQYYLIEAKTSLLDAWKKSYGAAVRLNQALTAEEFGSHMAYRRLLNSRMPPAAQDFYRLGFEAWQRKWKSHIDRDPESVMCGEMWVSDHHQLDVGCYWTTSLNAIPGMTAEVRQIIRDAKGKPRMVRPWITVWRDFRSGKILSCLIHDDAPNSDHVIYSLYLACVRYGVPREILLDNGKDYKTKTLTGHQAGVGLNDRDRSVCAALGIVVHFAIPYNAKAKPIERDFRKVKEWFAMYLPGYTGGHIKERPERLEDELKAGRLLNCEQLTEALHVFIEQVMNRTVSEGKYLKGASPDEFWDSHERAVRQVAPEELALCCMKASAPKQIRGQGLRYEGIGLDYYAEWMEGLKGRRAVLRVNLLEPTIGYVCDADTDILLGIAKANYWKSAAIIRKDDHEGAERLKALSRLQGREVKTLKGLAQALGLGTDHIDPIADAVAAQAAMGARRGYTPGKDQGPGGAIMIETTLSKAAGKIRAQHEAAAAEPFDVGQLAREAGAHEEADDTLYLFPEDRERAENSSMSGDLKRAVG